MRIENNSQTSFRAVTNTFNNTGVKVLKRIKGENIAVFVDELYKQDNNPVNIEFFFTKLNRMGARIYCDKECFQYKKTYKKWPFTSAIKFAEKMFNHADKVNKEAYEPAKQRFEMLK